MLFCKLLCFFFWLWDGTLQVLNAGYIDPKHQESHPDNTSITAVDTDWRWRNGVGTLYCSIILSFPCRFEYEKDNIVVLKKQSVVTRYEL